MQIVKVQFVPWDKVYYFDPAGIEVLPEDRVVVRTDLGLEIGTVLGLADPDEEEIKKNLSVGGAVANFSPATGEDGQIDLKPVVRKANAHDLEKLPDSEELRKALKYCKEQKDKYKLEMKFIDAHFSFDGSRATFAFIADGRVDFRELVKDLTRHFGRTIRLQQIGIRDEAKIMGDFGHCGKKLCCKGHLKELCSITSEMAELQQCSHRGSERISGICGRLMCCLAYENAGYEESAQKLPPIGAKVSVDGKRGVVVGHHILKQSVDVEFRSGKKDDRIVVEVDLNRHKKKKK